MRASTLSRTHEISRAGDRTAASIPLAAEQKGQLGQPLPHLAGQDPCSPLFSVELDVAIIRVCVCACVCTVDTASESMFWTGCHSYCPSAALPPAHRPASHRQTPARCALQCRLCKRRAAPRSRRRVQWPSGDCVRWSRRNKVGTELHTSSARDSARPAGGARPTSSPHTKSLSSARSPRCCVVRSAPRMHCIS